MPFRSRSFRFFPFALFCLFLTLPAIAQEAPPAASANGKYMNLLQILPCPQDKAQYGEFRDYGRWGGGPWCGQQGEAGFWVYVHPNWYVWGAEAPDAPPPAASANGKYRNLIQTLHCPKDAAQYGEFRDYGKWGGGPWCGQTGKAGYWVWVKPYWYVWSEVAASSGSGDVPPQASANGKYGGLIQILNCPKDAAQYGEFRDYGQWGGGPWCGQTGKAGYWVWVKPNWYVWSRQN